MPCTSRYRPPAVPRTTELFTWPAARAPTRAITTRPPPIRPATSVCSAGWCPSILDLNLVPGAGQTWEISSDGTVYTFHLRPNARFHDGRAVTAQDVIYSWERAADSATQSDTVLTYLGDIVGVAEMHAGQAQHISGLRAIDTVAPCPSRSTHPSPTS